MGKMGELLIRHRRIKQEVKDLALPDNERKALENISVESANYGAIINNKLNKDLLPSLKLGVFRRFGWKCSCCGSRNMLSLVRKGETDNTFYDLEVICSGCCK